MHIIGTLFDKKSLLEFYKTCAAQKITNDSVISVQRLFRQRFGINGGQTVPSRNTIL